ncbi:VanZ family protein [Streptomyces sp. NPDC015220]|uniref:VanZ family protein n=1 Tax=Streptomyces sp. NPDC015220 TaxID=3364947 RepID=UPI0036FE314A
MFTAIFQHHVGYLAACLLTALVLGGAAWALARRLGNPHSVWWAGLVFTLTGVLGVTFMNAGPASSTCVLNHQLDEPFHTTQGLWNLAMMVPVGILALMAVRRPLPVLVGVVVLPLGIEFTQATVDGLGRVCDSSDAEMNILGGLAGLAAAATVLTVRRSLTWLAGLKGTLITAATFLILGTGVASPMLDYTNVDGTGLSAADSDQKRAVGTAVKEAFGDRYTIGQFYEQPCVGAPCKNVIFNLHSREKGYSQEFGHGSLSWPDKKHLNVLLENRDRPTVMGYPVPGAKAPATAKEAYRVAESYARQQYPWVKDADVRQTDAVSDEARLGWITKWRWTHDGVLMPRMLDVQVDKAGQVAQVDVTLGPTRVNLPKGKLDAKQAENAVGKALAARLRSNGSADAAFQAKAFAVKAEDEDGTWTPNWLVNVSWDTEGQGGESQDSPPQETYRVDAISGQVYDIGGVPMKSR